MMERSADIPWPLRPQTGRVRTAAKRAAGLVAFGRAKAEPAADGVGLAVSAVIVFLSAVAILAVIATMARADTVVERGDVLSVTVLEDPTLGREAKVNLDGEIVLPQLGGIPVAGRDLAAVRTLIEDGLRERDIILQATVIVDMAQYRPFYVGGAVARPGAFPFEPGLTVRHALVLAGGVARSGTSDLPSAEDLEELKARFQDTSFSLMQAESLISRLAAELERSPPQPTGGPSSRPIAAEGGETVRSIDADILRNRIGQWNGELAKLRDMVALLTHEVDILQQQSTLQEQERALQLQEVERTRALYQKGLVPLQRVQDMEREASKMSRDLLETEAFEARAQQNKAAAEHDLAVADTVWRIATQRDLRDAELERATLKAELAALRGKMLSVGLTVQDDGSPVRPVQTVLIHRESQGVSESLQVTMDSDVRPGDVIDVTLEVRTDG